MCVCVGNAIAAEYRGGVTKDARGGPRCGAGASGPSAEERGAESGAEEGGRRGGRALNGKVAVTLQADFCRREKSRHRPSLTTEPDPVFLFVSAPSLSFSPSSSFPPNPLFLRRSSECRGVRVRSDNQLPESDTV